MTVAVMTCDKAVSALERVMIELEAEEASEHTQHEEMENVIS